MNNERPGLARIHKAPNPHLYCDIYTCRRLGAWIIEHREGMFGTDHLVLCHECAEAMVQHLPEELRRFATSNEPPRMDGLELLRALRETPEIRALVQGEEVAPEFRTALGGLIDMLADSEDKPFECDQCGKRFKTEMALRGHMASHRAKK